MINFTHSAGQFVSFSRDVEDSGCNKGCRSSPTENQDSTKPVGKRSNFLPIRIQSILSEAWPQCCCAVNMESLFKHANK